MAETAVVPSLVETASRLLPQLRARAPKIHCITNTVAQPITANVLLAAGVTPSLTTSREEIAAFAGSADGVLVNLGTLDAERRDAIEIALDRIGTRKIRWLLDPVFVERSPLRLDFARKLIARGPSVIRLNHAEFEALAGVAPSPQALRVFARTCHATVALTGETDLVSDGERLATLSHGDPLMTRVTAMGCAGSALVTSAIAAHEDVFTAAAAAVSVFGIAGEIAAAASDGPGSFAVAMIDSIHAMTSDAIFRHARVSDA